MFIPVEDLPCCSIQWIIVQRAVSREKATQKEYLWFEDPVPPQAVPHSFTPFRLLLICTAVGHLPLPELTSSSFHLKNKKAVSWFFPISSCLYFPSGSPLFTQPVFVCLSAPYTDAVPPVRSHKSTSPLAKMQQTVFASTNSHAF